MLHCLFYSGVHYGFATKKGWEVILFDIQIVPSAIIVTVLINYILTFTAFGMWLLMLSVLLRNVIITWIIGAIISVMGYFSWISLVLRPYYKWFPTSQMMFFSQFPNKLTENLFTPQWSITYNIIFFVTSFVITIIKIRTMNLSRKD